jgi:tetratricopeptide (TPR) repeat protein
MIGTTISHYRILRVLGVGGMSVVYLAEDLRLGRQVALKFLPPSLEHNVAALERLRREARLTSALNHPHICVIHDIGDHEARTFLVMERLEGTTLKRLIEQHGRLTVPRAIRIAAQVADALAAAHAQGIVHRDVKPGNVFITPRGDAKVTDFGLAKQLPLIAGSEDSTTAFGVAEAVTLTSPGEAVGTIAYMAPEQARGEPVDARSDLFSLGAVLYEMLTGRRAFAGTVPAIVFDAILNRQPDPARSLVPDVPEALDAILERLLAKNPADRYQSAAALHDDLRSLKGIADDSDSDFASTLARPASDGVKGVLDVTLPVPPPSGPGAAAAPRTQRRRVGVWAALVLVLVTALVALAVRERRPAAPPLTERDSILLANFANTTGDPVFDGTLSEALAVQLGQSPFLDLVAAERVTETLRLMGRAPVAHLAHDVARDLCERVNAKAMIEGAVRRLGQHFVITLTATGCADGETLALEQAEVERKEDVLKAVGRAATDLRARLGESLSTIESFGMPIEQATTPSLDALKAYTLGQAQRAQGHEIESIPFFRRAVDIDPQFAMAWFALSIVYGNLGEAKASTDYAARAYAERMRVSERERLAITYQYHDRVTGELSEAVASLELWKRLYPRDYRPANNLAVTFNRTGNFDRAAEEAREAMLRSPDRGLAFSNLAYALRGLNRFDESRRVAEDAVARGIETLPTRRLLYQLAVMRGDHEEAARHLAWAESRPRAFDFVGARAQVLAYEGRWAEARELYQQTYEMARAARLDEVAGAYAAQAAWTAALLGYPDEMRPAARALLDDESPQVRLMAATALALAADTAGLAPRIEAAQEEAPHDTLLVSLLAPVARGALRLAARRPQEAVEALRPAVPYDTGRASGLSSLYIRAEAFRAAGDIGRAVAEYARLLDARGTEPFAIFHALARLGLARSLAAAGEVDAASHSYEQFLTHMRGADDDLPAVQQAKDELRQIQGRRGTDQP